MQKIKIIFILMISLGVISACSHPKSSKSPEQAQQQTLIISEQKQTSTLYFDGNIAPIQTKVVNSPIDGIVESMNFIYGHQIKSGQLLIKLKSTSLGKNYQQAVSGYLTAKEKYGSSKSDMVGATELYKAGITSEQTYAAAQSDLNDSYLSFLQAKQTLIDLFKSSGISEDDVYLLRIDDEAAVKKALQTPLENLSVYAPMSGVALKPVKSGDSNSGGSTVIHQGSSIKSDQAIVEIGNMSGLKINIAVDELSINKIKVGDLAKVTGPGFPGITLNGAVSYVSSQASANDNGGGLPTFSVTVGVEDVTPDQQQIIHDGMSAKVEIDTGSPEEIIVPINAVHINGNQTYVELVEPTSGKIVKQAVQTGQTTINGVQIISGLKPGDKIVVGN